MKRKKLSFTTRYVLAIGLLLLVANILLGIIILRQTQTAMRTLIDKNMLDVAKSAAGTLDGDVLGALTEDDVGGEAFNDIAQKLTVFLNNVDIHFIYTVKESSEGKFTFIVDPDPVDPGAFGEEIVVTRAVIEAGKGVASVDDEPAADRWGNFYSVYSPVFDSKGAVAGLVGIDFDAEWYDKEVWHYTVSITLFTVLAVLAGGAVVFIITHNVRTRFRKLDAGLSRLRLSINKLMENVGAVSEKALEAEEETSEDEIERLEITIDIMQKEMGVYIDHLHRQAYTDSLTRVGNSAAYHERIKALEDKMPDVAFSIAIFDVNGLKQINDNLGHEYGDVAIVGAAKCIERVFGSDDTYRMGGDEFAVVRAHIDEDEMAAVAAAVEAFNAEQRKVVLAISMGVAHYVPGADASSKQVFARADQAMYMDKKNFYERMPGNERRNQPEPMLGMREWMAHDDE